MFELSNLLKNYDVYGDDCESDCIWSLCPFGKNELPDEIDITSFEIPDDYPWINRIEPKEKKDNANSTKISIPHFEIIHSEQIIHTEPEKKLRGKQIKLGEKRSKKERHCSTSEDNILTKIQVHFLNFLIYFLNDCIYTYYKNRSICFKKFVYKAKSKITSYYFNKMKNSTIYDILKETSISTKYKKPTKDINQKLSENLNQVDWFKKLFDLKFMELFYIYYNDKKQLKKVCLFDEEITLSNKTKSYYFLLEKNFKEKKEIIETTKYNYHVDNIDKSELNKIVKVYP